MVSSASARISKRKQSVSITEKFLFVKSKFLAQNTHSNATVVATETRVLVTQTITSLPGFKAISGTALYFSSHCD